MSPRSNVATLAATSLALALASCYKPDYGDGQFRCEQDGLCPPGLVCSPAGLCVKSFSEDAAADAVADIARKEGGRRDGAAGEQAGAKSPCTKVTTTTVANIREDTRTFAMALDTSISPFATFAYLLPMSSGASLQIALPDPSSTTVPSFQKIDIGHQGRAIAGTVFKKVLLFYFTDPVNKIWFAGCDLGDTSKPCTSSGAWLVSGPGSASVNAFDLSAGDFGTIEAHSTKSAFDSGASTDAFTVASNDGVLCTRTGSFASPRVYSGPNSAVYSVYQDGKGWVLGSITSTATATDAGSANCGATTIIPVGFPPTPAAVSVGSNKTPIHVVFVRGATNLVEYQVWDGMDSTKPKMVETLPGSNLIGNDSADIIADSSSEQAFYSYLRKKGDNGVELWVRRSSYDGSSGWTAAGGSIVLSTSQAIGLYTTRILFDGTNLHIGASYLLSNGKAELSYTICTP